MSTNETELHTAGTELDSVDSGLILAALEAFAEDHPDTATADRCLDLAELIATHRLILAPPD